MARPYKEGCSYFPSDVDIYSDFKIIDLLNEYGPLGYTVYDWVIRRVYQEGYYLQTDLNQLSTFFVRDIGSKWIRNKEVVLQVIHFCAELDLFDKDLLAQGVITSVGIQRRYVEITARRRQPNILSKFCILPDAFLSVRNNAVIDNNNLVIVNKNEVNGSNNDVKKRKEKESNTGTEESAPAVIELSLNDNSMYPINQKQVDEMASIIPGSGYSYRTEKMQARVTANPKRRKTKKGILRFIVNWLMKEQDKPHREVTSKNAYPNL